MNQTSGMAKRALAWAVVASIGLLSASSTVTAAPQGPRECGAAALEFDYSADTASATLEIPPCPLVAKRGQQRLKLRGSITRFSLIDSEEAGASRSCPVRTGCSFTLTIAHPTPEVTDYAVEYLYRSKNGKIQGAIRAAARCYSLVLAHDCFD